VSSYARRQPTIRRILYRTLLAFALLSLLAKIPFTLLRLPDLDHAPSEPPPAPRGLALQNASRHRVFGTFTARKFAFLKSNVRPGDTFYLAASARSVGTAHERFEIWAASTFYFLPNVLTLDLREADVVFTIGGSPPPPGHYLLVAEDRSGDRVFRRVATQ
jgi:hypothetical protein